MNTSKKGNEKYAHIYYRRYIEIVLKPTQCSLNLKANQNIHKTKYFQINDVQQIQ